MCSMHTSHESCSMQSCKLTNSCWSSGETYLKSCIRICKHCKCDVALGNNRSWCLSHRGALCHELLALWQLWRCRLDGNRRCSSGQLNTSCCTFDRVLFQTTTLAKRPLLSRLRAMAVPMIPRPKKPTVIGAILLH